MRPRSADTSCSEERDQGIEMTAPERLLRRLAEVVGGAVDGDRHVPFVSSRARRTPWKRGSG